MIVVQTNTSRIDAFLTIMLLTKIRLSGLLDTNKDCLLKLKLHVWINGRSYLLVYNATPGI